MDPEFAYQVTSTCCRNTRSSTGREDPHLRGGWADTRGFYAATTKGDCSVNTAGINAFADSAVGFIRQYGFDGGGYRLR